MSSKQEESYQKAPLLLPFTRPGSSSSSSVDSFEAVDRPPKFGLRSKRASALSLTLLATLWIASIALTWHTAKSVNEIDLVSELVSSRPAVVVPAVGGGRLDPAPSQTPSSDDHARLVNFDIEGKYNGTGLAQLCSATEWAPNRWMSCDRIEGGIGNVRNEVLLCLRYTIAAGAGWSLPSLRLRGEVAYGEESLHTGGRSGLEFFFDVDHLKSTLAEFCPQMAVADSLYDIPSFGLARIGEPIKPKEVYTLATGKANSPRLPWPALQNLEAASFRKDFDKVYSSSESEDRVTIHRLDFAYFQWDPELDPPEVWQQFGRLLKFAAPVIELASEVHRELVAINGSYFGMHERLEKDVGEEWGTFEDQSKDYVNHLLERPHLTQVYLACGDESVLPRVATYINETRGAPHIRVHSKETLLASSKMSQAKLAKMHFDQKAQIDYLVLLLADYHVGPGTSSFSANLGVRRHLTVEGKERNEVFMQNEDEKTYLFIGWHANFMRRTMWP